MSNRLSRRGAFTLVELLVVIGIIALLIGILLPALSKAKQRARTAACLSNLHNLSIGMNGYLITYKGRFPEGIGPNGGVEWWTLMSEYLGLTKHENAVSKIPTDDNRGLAIFLCPDASISATPQQKHYSVHPLLMPDMQQTYPASFPATALQGKQRVPYRVTRIPNPSEIVLIWDSNQRADNGNAWAVAFNLDNNRISNAGAPTPPGMTFLTTATGADLGQSIDGGPNVESPTSTVAGTDPQRKWANVRWRHAGNTMANFLYVDGHAGSLRYNAQLRTELLRRNVCVPLP